LRGECRVRFVVERLRGAGGEKPLGFVPGLVPLLDDAAHELFERQAPAAAAELRSGPLNVFLEHVARRKIEAQQREHVVFLHHHATTTSHHATHICCAGEQLHGSSVALPRSRCTCIMRHQSSGLYALVVVEECLV
jgi:hypothetical protein